ncbi:MAG: hypothetical protein GY729_16045 [Desulfobacteraceae bacterium]|nr:hypothetical protein [Desulfobacteraceae bacterium]
MPNFAIVVSFCLFIVSCVARPVVHISDLKKHAQQNKFITEAVHTFARTGDWLVIRGYNATDNLVSNITAIPISHVGVFDSESSTVIEAEGKGVHETSLDKFVNKSYRLLIIRPRWLQDTNRKKVISNTRKLIGKNYDFLGTIGFNYPDSYYCSELAVFIFKEWHSSKEKFPFVIKPGDLYLYGKILFDSLPRDEF